MADSAYVFWCSNCKVEHGGECPPVGTVYLQQVSTHLPDHHFSPAPMPAVGDPIVVEFHTTIYSSWAKSWCDYVVEHVDSDGSIVVRNKNKNFSIHLGAGWASATGCLVRHPQEPGIDRARREQLVGLLSP